MNEPAQQRGEETYRGSAPLSGDAAVIAGADIGIGNQATGNPDWTFAANAGSYEHKRLRVFVHYK